MKRVLIIISLCLFLVACQGSTNLPFNYSIEVMGWEKYGMGLVDRKIESIELDVSQKGYAIFIITMADEIQIDKKRKTLFYTIYFRLYENKMFRVRK